jgi:hypothetical protein
VNPSERKFKNPLKRHTLNLKNKKKFQQVHVCERERVKELLDCGHVGGGKDYAPAQAGLCIFV